MGHCKVCKGIMTVYTASFVLGWLSQTVYVSLQMKCCCLDFSSILSVVYFVKHLGAVYSKHQLNYAFAMFFAQKKLKKNPLPAFGCKLKKTCFLPNFASIFLLLPSSAFFVKKHIWTIIWSVQHPKAGKSMQQQTTTLFCRN